MDMSEIVSWAREENLECPFVSVPTECEGAAEMARKLAEHIQDLCGDDQDLRHKVTWIMERGAILASIS